MSSAPPKEPTDETLFVGTPYHCLGAVGAGRMGTAYLVEHRGIHRKFVAKVIHKALVPDPKAVDRFRLEAQSLGRIECPHIVAIEGTGTTADGRPFLVLEYLDGHTLSDELRTSEIGLRTAVRYVGQLLSALQAAHQAHVVHRDLTPGNIFITTGADGKPFVKVLDFGLAKVLLNAPTDAPSPLFDPTTLGNVIGTPSYMSPEQALGRDVDERGDIYAAAVVFYEMLTGVGPFEHLGRQRQMAAHVREQPKAPSRLAKERISKELDRVILKALSKDPRERYSSATEFRDAILTSAFPKARRPKKSKPMTKKAVFRLFVVVMLLTACAAVVTQLVLFK